MLSLLSQSAHIEPNRSGALRLQRILPVHTRPQLLRSSFSLRDGVSYLTGRLRVFEVVHQRLETYLVGRLEHRVVVFRQVGTDLRPVRFGQLRFK